MACCFKCEKKIVKVDEKNTKISCHGCERAVCVKCSGLTATELRVVILSAQSLRYLCPDCEVGLRELPTLKKLLNDLTLEIGGLRQEIAEMKKSRGEVLNLDLVVEELEERRSRSSNVILFGIPESSAEDAEQRKQEDASSVERALAALPQPPRPRALIRLGKPKPGSTAPRPLKLIMAGKRESISVLKNKSKLPSSVSAKSDLTLYQRDKLKRLREELAERVANGEDGITIKYINNCPKIVQVAKK